MLDDRPIDDIEEGEIHQLVVSRARERQRLEFKATLNTRNDPQSGKAKQEMLVDIASLANAEGGFLIYGINDNGDGTAAGYSQLTEADALRIKTTITELVVRHISERIEGLEVRHRVVEGNHIIMVRVPIGGKIPHMVTIDDSTIFATRHDDGKRKMTIGEIRSAFNDDLFGRKLARVEQELSALLQHSLRSGALREDGQTVEQLSAIENAISQNNDGRLLSDARRRAAWEQHE